MTRTHPRVLFSKRWRTQGWHETLWHLTLARGWQPFASFERCKLTAGSAVLRLLKQPCRRYAHACARYLCNRPDRRLGLGCLSADGAKLLGD